MQRRIAIAALALASLAHAADVANMSGTWVLNAKRSQWGKKERPYAAQVQIQHQEPSYNYQGTVNRSEQSEPDRFQFEGAIDGKDYPIMQDKAKRTMSVTRKAPNAIESTVKTPDGKVEQTMQTSVSTDGKTLTQKLQLTDPSGQRANWTEIYEKK